MGGNPEHPARHAYRFKAGVRAELHQGTGRMACEAVNLSRTGVLLIGELEAPTTDTVDFSLQSSTGSFVVTLTGRVVRVTPDAPDGGITIALELIEMDAARQDALETLLARLLESPAVSVLESLKPNASPLEIKKALESIPLPQRIGMAVRASSKERESLKLDTNPAVLEALIRNPNLAVAEARAIVTSVFLLAGTLDLLANDPRFKEDEELRMSIATHPRVSMSTAERVTADFKVPQLKKLLSKPGLNQLLRERLFRKTTQR